MKKKATALPAKAASRQSTLNFPTSSEADLVAESAAAETSTKSGAKNRRKRTADFADDADKHSETNGASSVPVSSAPTERNKIAQGKKRSAAALGQHPSITESPEGATESSALPEGWRCTTVAESITIIDYRGRTPPFDGTVIPHLRSQNVKSGRVVWHDLAFVSDDTYTAFMTRGIPQKGDLLFTTEAPLGEVAPVPVGKFSVAQRIMILRPCPETWVPAFLMYQLMSPEVQARIRRKGTGSTVTGVASRNFKPIQLVAAPLPEQHRIVAEIEKQFTRLDAGVAALKRVQANLKRYRAAVLKAACEGKLVPTEAELAQQEGRTYETGEQLLQRILTHRRQNWQGSVHYKDPSVADTTNLPAPPQGWTWATPDQLAAADIGAICAGPFGTIFKAHDFRPEGIPIIFLRHVAPGRYLTRKPGFMDVAKWEELFQPYSVFGGELLVTKLGEPPGVCAIFPEGIGPAMVTPDVIKMTPNTNAACPQFLMHYFNSQTARDFATGVAFGTTRLRLTLPIFREMPVPLPPHSEQTRIVDEVERRLSVVEELESVVTANLQRVSRLRQAILQKAFIGEL